MGGLRAAPAIGIRIDDHATEIIALLQALEAAPTTLITAVADSAVVDPRRYISPARAAVAAEVQQLLTLLAL